MGSASQQSLMELLLWSGIWNLQIKNITTKLKKITNHARWKRHIHLLMFQQVLWSVCICRTVNCCNYVLNVCFFLSNDRKDKEKPNKPKKKMPRNFNNVYNADSNISNNGNNRSRSQQHTCKWLHLCL